MAPQVLEHPGARTTASLEATVIKESVAHTGHEATATRERGTCFGCGTTTKTLMAPIPNARGYEGPMYCMSCNPRFFTVDRENGLVHRRSGRGL